MSAFTVPGQNSVTIHPLYGRRKQKPYELIHCHGQMKCSKTPFHVDRNGYHLVLDTVPAWVCHQCGEAYFEKREVDAIQSVIKGLDQQARQLVTDT